jgi:cytochrome c-type biogenesis protein CcmF
LPRADWGKFLAHSGMGFVVLGIASVSAWESEDIRLARLGDTISLGGYEFHFDEVVEGQGPNYVYQRGRFTVTRGGDMVTVMEPEKRLYVIQRRPSTESAIATNLARDLYLVLGDKQTGAEAWAVRIYVKPLVIWIWLGFLITAAGGLVSLSDRRFRVGATVRRQRAAPVPGE